MKKVEHLEYLAHSDTKDIRVAIYSSIFAKICPIKKYY